MSIARMRVWPILAVALLAATCLRGSRPDQPWTARENLPPISLLTADGVELKLLAVEARVLLLEPLAFTELHLRFRNPEARVLEGRFRVVLPPTASVARFAMKVQERWEEGELVELAEARAAYEMFLHRRQDPALLEQSAGNEFQARIFPIAANEEKELILGYSEDLVAPDAPYRIAWKGIRGVARATVNLSQPGPGGLVHEQRKVPTTQDFTQPLRGGDIVLRHGALVVGRVTAPGRTRPAPLRSLVVLLDTSASRALGLPGQIRLLRGLLAEAQRQEGDFAVRVLAFDQEVSAIYDGPASGFGDEQERMLRERGALGASNLELALRTLDHHLAEKPAERILVIGDGVTTAGALDGASLARLEVGLAQRGAKRLDAIVGGGVQDQARLAALTSGFPDPGAVLSGDRAPAWLLSRLTRQVSGDPEPLPLASAAWHWPRELRGVLPGDPLLMVARLPSADARLDLRNVVSVDAELAPLLERALARAQVAELEQKLDETHAAAEADRNELKQRLKATSIAGRVLCRLTGFVVLENDFAWQQAGVHVEPTHILSLDETGLHLTPHERQQAGCCGPEEMEAITLERDMKAEVSPRRLDMQLQIRAHADAEESEAPPARPASPPAPATDPAVVSDLTPLAGLPELPALPAGGDTSREPTPASSPAAKRQAKLPTPPVYRESDFAKRPKAHTGRFGDILAELARGDAVRARSQAEAWRADEPGQALAYVALGEACRATGDVRRAARAYGSIIDLYPARADLRRFAAGRLASLVDRAALELAIDSAWRAVEQRPDHPSGHHLAATLLLEAGRYAQAMAVLTQALKRSFDQRFLDAQRILREDAGLAAAAWAKAEPGRAAELARRLVRLEAPRESEPSLRFVLTWESDANDVDFHVRDGLGYHAFYRRPTLPTGGELYADVRDGYGPECFTLREPADRRAYPYRLSVHYARRGPMGYGMGTVQIIDHDGRGTLRFDHRPFVIMNDAARLNLAEVRGIASNHGAGLR
jgi:tetratricopeptide (TPR) repeat protein